MLRHKAYRFRIYPTQEQATLIHKMFGCSRFVFNHFLARWNDAYKETGKGDIRNGMGNMPQDAGIQGELVWKNPICSGQKLPIEPTMFDSCLRLSQ